GVHLSRLAEALILFSTAEFGFVQLSDAYSTGSSLMSQKKNPDPLELTRGKAGTLIGLLTGLLATLKATPSAYDKDLQEDKAPVFQACDTLLMMLPVMSGLLESLAIEPKAMAAALDPSMLATELADDLVRRGVPFRTAHSLIGQVVRKASELNLPLDRLPSEHLQAVSPVFGPVDQQVFDFRAAVERRNASGGTAARAVEEQLQQAKSLLK
ncbi:MAG TPA: lyase family protein, partial [Anaerolineaceae bacterium]|nr:lyase family protein [Anaerolineaceae bacterium]